MIQETYKLRIMKRFMLANELTKFDTKYQSQKVPSANNLGQQTLDQLVDKMVTKKFNDLQKVR